MNILNDYCLIHIFKYLNPKDRLNASKVCSRWNIIIEVYCKERKLTILDNCNCEKNEIIQAEEIREIIRQYGPYLQDVSLIPMCEPNKTSTFVQFGAFRYSATNFTTKDALEILSQVAVNILSLYIRCCHHPTKLIKKLLVSNKKLNKLEIEGDYNYFEDLVNLDLLPESLEQLSFSFIYIESCILCLFLQRMTNLRKLKLIEGNLVTDESMLTLSTYATQLKTLHLEEDVEDGSGISIMGMESLSKLVNLEELSIKGFINTMIDSIIIKITKNCNKIRELALSGCSQITNNGMKKALTYLQNLQALEIKNLSITHLSCQRYSLDLKELKIYRCESLSSDAICEAIQIMPLLSHLEVHTSSPVSERVMYTAITAAMSRNQNWVVTEDINSTEKLHVKVYRKSSYDSCVKESEKSIFYFHCQPKIKDWLKKVQNHVTSTLPKCQISKEIKQ